MAERLRRAGRHDRGSGMVCRQPHDARRHRGGLSPRLHRLARAAILPDRPLSPPRPAVAEAGGARLLPQDRAPEGMKHPILLVAVLSYAAASLLHHVHNAVFLDEYPHMPAWITPGIVYAAWVATTAVGLAGLFYRPLLAAYGGL